MMEWAYEDYKSDKDDFDDSKKMPSQQLLQQSEKESDLSFESVEFENSSSEKDKEESIFSSRFPQSQLQQKKKESESLYVPNQKSQIRSQFQQDSKLDMSILEGKGTQMQYPNHSLSSQIHFPQNQLDLEFSRLLSKSYIQRLHNHEVESEQTTSQEKEFDIRITKTESIVGAFKPFIVYQIDSRWTDFTENHIHSVKRRYNEFKALKEYLQSTYISRFQPTFPDPSVTESFLPIIQLLQKDSEVVTTRSEKLEQYLRKLAQLDFIQKDSYFEMFLSSTEEFKQVQIDSFKDHVFFSQQNTSNNNYPSINGFLEKIKNIMVSTALSSEAGSNAEDFYFMSKGTEKSDQNRLFQQDHEMQTQLKNKLAHLQSLASELKKIRSLYSETNFEILDDILKKGENAVQSPDGFIFGLKEIYFQNDALSYYFKFFPIQHEKSRQDEIVGRLDQLLEKVQAAKESYDRLQLKRYQLLAKIKDYQKRKQQGGRERTPMIDEEFVDQHTLKSLNANKGEALQIVEIQEIDDDDSIFIIESKQSQLLKQQSLLQQQQLEQQKENLSDEDSEKNKALSQIKEQTESNISDSQQYLQDSKQYQQYEDEEDGEDESNEALQEERIIEKFREDVSINQKEQLDNFEELIKSILPMALEEFTQKSISLSYDNYKQKDSISKRLFNLKKFYNAPGPAVDSQVVVKQLSQSQRQQQMMVQCPSTAPTGQSRIHLTNLIAPHNNQMKKEYAMQKNSFQSQLGYFSQNDKDEVKISQSQLFFGTSHNNYTIPTYTNISSHDNTAPTTVKRSSQIYDGKEKPGSSSQNGNASLYSLKTPSTQQQKRRTINKIQQQSLQQPSQQNQDNNLPNKSPSYFDMESSCRSFNNNNNNNNNSKQQQEDKQNAFNKKGGHSKNTENFLKQEINNAKQDLCKKFLLCQQYEAHRNFKSDPLQAEKVYLTQLDSMQSQLNDLLLLVNSSMHQTRDVESIDNTLMELNNLAQLTKSGYLQVLFLMIQSKIQYQYRDYVKSIHLAKRSKNLAQQYGYLHEKMKNYQLIANSFNMLHKHKLSIIYQIKVLRLSWLIGNENQELKSYDHLGKCYYYLGDLEKAYYFHEKMMTGEIEKDSQLKQLSNNKLQNRGFLSNTSSHLNRKINKEKAKGSNLNDSNISITEEEELVSSSDDEFEIHVDSSKLQNSENNNNRIQHQQSKEGEDNNNSNSIHHNTWADKLIMAKLKVLQLQRSREMMITQKKRSTLMNLNKEDEIGKAECKMDQKNSQYLQKILQKRGKSTAMQKKFRISHLTPNRSILQYHEAEAQYLKIKSYTATQYFIPTIDGQCLKNISNTLNKIKTFLSQIIPIISSTLFNSQLYQKILQQQRLEKQQQEQNNNLKFKRIQDNNNNNNNPSNNNNNNNNFNINNNNY